MMMKRILIGCVVVMLLLMLVPLYVVWVENGQLEENYQRLNNLQFQNELPATSVVIVFSRSGNTAVLGRYLAKQKGADFYQLRADDYDPGLTGWINAMIDARSSEAEIKPNHIDLSQYGTIYLGSPIWLYSPAPPIWKFAKNNQFDGKAIVLFNTFNSKFEQKYIDEFEVLVKAQGASSFEHRFVKRGRMPDQISTEVMLKQFDQSGLSN